MEYLRNWEIQEYQLYHATLKECQNGFIDLGASVSVMPFSLYKILDLNKVTPTEISLQMDDKSTVISSSSSSNFLLSQFAVLL